MLELFAPEHNGMSFITVCKGHTLWINVLYKGHHFNGFLKPLKEVGLPSPLLDLYVNRDWAVITPHYICMYLRAE